MYRPRVIRKFGMKYADKNKTRQGGRIFFRFFLIVPLKLCSELFFLHMELTTSEIASNLLTNAFSTERTTASNKNLSTTSRMETVKTDSITETLKLLNGSSTNLDTVISNLTEMKTIAESITNSSTEEEREEAYAMLRSLASGIDDVLEKTTFDGEDLFDGTQLNLNSAGTYGKTVLQNLMTTGDVTGLATSGTGAEVTLSYDEFSLWNNTIVGLEGLDISNPTSCEIGAEDTELETGDYVLKVEYLGSKSTVSILDTDGTVISSLEDVDLSGSGVETLTFDCGVSLDIDKTQVAGSDVDKYDYETNGAAVLFANLNYTRINTYDLSGSQEATDRSISTDFVSKTSTDSEGGTFSISKIGFGALDEEDDEVESGRYSVEVYKIGEKASAIMYDTNGNVVGGVSNVELSSDGTTTLDFGNGVVLTVDNENFDGNATQRATFDYTQAVDTYDDFDFEAYADQIDSAITAVTEQQDVIDEAAALTTTVYQAIKGTLTSSVYSTTSQIITNLLGGSTSSTSAISLLSGSSSSNTGLTWATGLITNNLSTALGLSSDTGTTLSNLLGGSVSSIDPLTLPSTTTYSS